MPHYIRYHIPPLHVQFWAWVVHLTPQMLFIKCHLCEDWVAHSVTCSHSFSSRQAADVILKFHELALTPTAMADWRNRQIVGWLPKGWKKIMWIFCNCQDQSFLPMSTPPTDLTCCCIDQTIAQENLHTSILLAEYTSLWFWSLENDSIQ